MPPRRSLPADRRTERQVLEDLNRQLEQQGGVPVGLVDGFILSVFLWAAVLLLVCA